MPTRLTPTQEALVSLRKEKKKIQRSKNPLGHYSRAQSYRLLQINMAIVELSRFTDSAKH